MNVNKSIFKDEVYYNEILEIDDIEETGRFLRRAKFMEYQLKESNKDIVRNGPLLKYKEFSWYDPYSRLYGYNLIQILNEYQIVLRKQYYEGHQYVIFNTKTKKESFLGYSEAYFNSDKSQFYTIGQFYTDEYEVLIFKKYNEMYEELYRELIDHTDDYGFQYPVEEHYWENTDKIIEVFKDKTYEVSF